MWVLTVIVSQRRDYTGQNKFFLFSGTVLNITGDKQVITSTDGRRRAFSIHWSFGPGNISLHCCHYFNEITAPAKTCHHHTTEKTPCCVFVQ